MRLLRILLLALTLAGLVNNSGIAQPTVQVDQKTRTHLQKYRADYVASMLANNPDKMAVYFGDTIRLMTEFQKTVIGKPNVLAYYRAFFGRFTVKSYRRNELEMLDLGSRVVELGQFTLVITAKNIGKEFTVQGKYQTLWERQNTGNLAVITEGWNYDHSLDIGDALRFGDVPVVDVALLGHVPITNAVRFELTALNRLMEVTVAEHDGNLWSQFYSDEAILFAQHQTYCNGRKAIDAYVEAHIKALPIFEKLAIRNDRVDDLGNYVIEYANHIAVWRGGDYSGVGVGKDLRIWRREKGGSLKIFRHIAMYD